MFARFKSATTKVKAVNALSDGYASKDANAAPFQNSAVSLASLPISQSMLSDEGVDTTERPDVDPVTELAPWFVVGLPRPALKLVATNLVTDGRPGEFMVRCVGSTVTRSLFVDICVCVCKRRRARVTLRAQFG